MKLIFILDRTGKCVFFLRPVQLEEKSTHFESFWSKRTNICSTSEHLYTFVYFIFTKSNKKCHFNYYLSNFQNFRLVNHDFRYIILLMSQKKYCVWLTTAYQLSRWTILDNCTSTQLPECNCWKVAKVRQSYFTIRGDEKELKNLRFTGKMKSESSRQVATIK